MNNLSPFSPPGNPPVKPIISFSNPSGFTSKETDGSGFNSGSGSGDAGSGLGLGWVSSFWTPISPLQRPRPPKISDRLGFANGEKLACLKRRGWRGGEWRNLLGRREAWKLVAMSDQFPALLWIEFSLFQYPQSHTLTRRKWCRFLSNYKQMDDSRYIWAVDLSLTVGLGRMAAPISNAPF